MSAAKTYRVRVDLKTFSVTELTSAYVNLRQLYRVAESFGNQPRCKNIVGEMFDDMNREIICELQEAVVKEITTRVPVSDDDKHQRDFVIVSESLFEFSPIELVLADAFKKIGRKVVL